MNNENNLKTKISINEKIQTCYNKYLRFKKRKEFGKFIHFNKKT